MTRYQIWEVTAALLPIDFSVELVPFSLALCGRFFLPLVGRFCFAAFALSGRFLWRCDCCRIKSGMDGLLPLSENSQDCSISTNLITVCYSINNMGLTIWRIIDTGSVALVNVPWYINCTGNSHFTHRVFYIKWMKSYQEEILYEWCIHDRFIGT